MKKVYFILTDTGTALSKIIRFFMKDEYAHVSISLDKNLNQMYSFGRINPYNPFYGGFIHEYIDKGTFKRFYKTKARILEFNVTEEQFRIVKTTISKFKRTNKDYKFNIIGLFAIYFNIKRQKEDYYYCAEFIKYVTENANLNLELPDLVRPENFKEIKGSTIIYEGLLQKYKPAEEEKKLIKKIS